MVLISLIALDWKGLEILHLFSSSVYLSSRSALYRAAIFSLLFSG